MRAGSVELGIGATASRSEPYQFSVMHQRNLLSDAANTYATERCGGPLVGPYRVPNRPPAEWILHWNLLPLRNRRSRAVARIGLPLKTNTISDGDVEGVCEANGRKYVLQNLRRMGNSRSMIARAPLLELSNLPLPTRFEAPIFIVHERITRPLSPYG